MGGWVGRLVQVDEAMLNIQLYVSLVWSTASLQGSVVASPHHHPVVVLRRGWGEVKLQSSSVLYIIYIYFFTMYIHSKCYKHQCGLLYTNLYIMHNSRGLQSTVIVKMI